MSKNEGEYIRTFFETNPNMAIVACTDIYETFRKENKHESEYPPLINMLNDMGFAADPKKHDPVSLSRSIQSIEKVSKGFSTKNSEFLPKNGNGLIDLISCIRFFENYANSPEVPRTKQVETILQTSEIILDLVAKILQPTKSE